MATVELAEDTELRRRVAVKRLAASLAGDELLQERFFREARLAAALSHPNLVAVYDVGEEDGLPYIVMEYVEGETLAELAAREGPLQPERAVEILVQICAGLEHAHAEGLVHRDIKPQNLLLRRDGVAKIADFGIARTLQATQLTEVGTVLGTAAYLAPEQAAGERVTPAADIYSLGAVAYELLSGRPPYQFDSLADLVQKQRKPPAPIPNVPPQLDRAIRGALAFEPRDRTNSASALARELGRREATAVTQVLPRARTIHVSWRVLLVVAGALAVLAIAVVLGYAYRGDDSQSPPPAPAQRVELVPRGETPAESARLLAEWLRERAG